MKNENLPEVSTSEQPDGCELLSQKEKWRLFRQGALAVSPLCVAVVPWGLLAGSFAIDAGMDVFQSMAMSAIVFAGAAQLVATGLIKAGVGLFTILLTTFFITSRHLLYSITMRQTISPLPLRWRLGLGFLLTDELFALCGNQTPERFQPWYALGAGLWFYLSWNLATIAGIFAGKLIPNLESLGLDFAIAATFIAIVIPTIQRWPVLVAVIVALLTSVLMAALDMKGGLMIASLLAMICGYLTEKWIGNHPIHREKPETQQGEFK